MKELRIGLIGTGSISNAHLKAYQSAGNPISIVALCDLDIAKAEMRKDQFSLAPSCVTTDYRELLAIDDLDAVDICTSNDSHVEIAREAAMKRIPFLCEKPVGRTRDEVQDSYDVLQAHPVEHMIGFCYRFVPAVRYAKSIIEQGRLGDIYHVQAHYSVDRLPDASIGLEWRMQRSISGSGALGDLGSHLIDLVGYMSGERLGLPQTTHGQLNTFISQRHDLADPDQMKLVTNDDIASFSLSYDGGTIGSFTVSRVLSGHQTVEVYGSGGYLKYSLAAPNSLILRTKLHEQPFREEASQVPVPVEYQNATNASPMETELHYFTQSLLDGSSMEPNIQDGMRNQSILDAVERACVDQTVKQIGL